MKVASVRSWIGRVSIEVIFLIFLGIAPCALAGTSAATGTPLDKGLQPDEKDEISNVFRDMGVVQKRAMAKGGRFLFSTYGSFDFSDGPYTNYSISVNPGYALSDFFEIYFNYAPKFFVSPRSIVGLVEGLTLQDGRRAEIVAGVPQRQMGGELLWAPTYGKDSVGMHSVIRSDTFFKLGVSQITYDVGTGMRFAIGAGKTYFLGRYAGFRICIDYSHVETIVNGEKSFRDMALVESGIVLYM